MQKRLGTALHSYKEKRWGAVLSAGKGTGSKDVTDPIIYCMLTAMGMPSIITKVIKSLLLQLVGPYIITLIMGPPEGSILISQMVIKLGLSTTKIKYLTGIYMISQNVYHLCFAASFMSMWAQSNSERVH